jgi:hypothetical protein
MMDCAQFQNVLRDRVDRCNWELEHARLFLSSLVFRFEHGFDVWPFILKEPVFDTWRLATLFWCFLQCDSCETKHLQPINSMSNWPAHSFDIISVFTGLPTAPIPVF